MSSRNVVGRIGFAGDFHIGKIPGVNYLGIRSARPLVIP
jgi:hypothetical protein